ncbi:helix-turn-helix domain-containing protein [Halopenitus persicus]|uniref:Predicted DNA binding protein, contains HTH domain n=1 Tax=Halopenitus persicus TaxID=1048396 RepID=A0A1H3DLN0_9EURY|nr:helix-turn-helix domain-containing protein [Halopenitus persicus]QHS16273.1 helix-turn-helix domain-containing protein [haloarchaeon 3A1-DGR]SDX66559.1 Predicted DNA binding protein, contains HTH domain [Halopenitus persicus]
MTQARLVVEMPEGPWVADVSRAHPDATFQVLAALPGDGPGFALVWISATDLDAVLEDMRDHAVLTDMSVMQRTETEATVQFETTAPMLLVAAKRSGIPIEMPIEIQNGEATIDVTGAHDRLSELGRQFKELEMDFRIEYIQERLQPSQVLTENQQRLLLTAVELGYYDTPRECSLTELADRVGIAKSTCSETLHRAEEEIIKRFVDDLPPRVDAEPNLDGADVDRDGEETAAGTVDARD